MSLKSARTDAPSCRHVFCAIAGQSHKKLFCPRLFGKNLPVKRDDLFQQLIGFFAHNIFRAVRELDHCIGRRLENLDQVMVQVKYLAV